MSNIKERIGIVGRGIVGQALANGFEEHEIHIYDKYQDSETLANVCKNSEFIFIALPTPMKGDKIDLSIIDENIEQIVKITDNTTKIVVIKSTVVPGTTANYEKRYPNTLFAFNPEFLKEATFTEDFLNPDRTVIGASNAQVALRVLNLYTKRFPKTKIFRTDPTTAEMVKYMANSLFATLVIYNNIAYDLCQALDISYDEVTSMVKEDSRLHSLKNYFQVTSARGFGGKCLDGKELVYRVEDTKIVPMKIRDFVDAYTGNEYILSHDFLNSKYFVADRVTGVARREVDKVARVLFDDGTEIKTSVDHLFTLKNKKIIEVSKLNVGDEVR
ncbi:MAG: hypothetical protein HQ538_06425, partial [Parcubacteria group bacterium]|nr:hypothetical protein [Parcubacteria group bacterium]